MNRSERRVVMVSGKFDPPHEGHIDHIMKASKLGNFLIVVTQPDEGILAVKGKVEIPVWARIALLKGILLYYDIPGEVYVGLDTDGKSVKSLRFFKPEVFAKGGDRTPQNMPHEEILECNEGGIRLEYGVGDPLNESSKIKLDKEEL